MKLLKHGKGNMVSIMKEIADYLSIDNRTLSCSFADMREKYCAMVYSVKKTEYINEIIWTKNKIYAEYEYFIIQGKEKVFIEIITKGFRNKCKKYINFGFKNGTICLVDNMIFNGEI